MNDFEWEDEEEIPQKRSLNGILVNDGEVLVHGYIDGNGETIIHRADGPSIVHFDVEDRSIKIEYWHQNGLLHREDGPAIIHSNGAEEWYLNGLPHRVNGPATEYGNGKVRWCVNGLSHRTGGPAKIVTDIDGDHHEWWEYGKHKISGSHKFSEISFGMRPGHMIGYDSP